MSYQLYTNFSNEKNLNKLIQDVFNTYDKTYQTTFNNKTQQIICKKNENELIYQIMATGFDKSSIDIDFIDTNIIHVSSKEKNIFNQKLDYHIHLSDDLKNLSLINHKDISASFINGVLTLCVPFTKQKQSIKINIL